MTRIRLTLEDDEGREINTEKERVYDLPGGAHRLVVVDCNRNGSGLQSAHFQDHIICIYPPPQDRIKCD